MAPEEGPTHARGPSVELQGIWEAVMEDMEANTDDLLLKDGQSEKFKCAVCLEVMLEPVSLVKCGHNICKACATQLLASKTIPGERSQRKCPTCRERIRSYVPAYQFREVIMGAVRVRCVNEGCTAEVPIERLGGHLKQECAHRRFTCLLEDAEGSKCGAVVVAGARAEHEAVCPHTPMPCTHDGCGEKVVRREFEAHAGACGHREVQCGKCEKVYKDMHAAKHKEEECLEEEVPCGLCQDRMLRRLLQGHMVDPVAQATHMNVMAKEMAELKSTCAELRAENATLKRKVKEQDATLSKRQARSVSTESGSYVMTVCGHAEMTWEADLTEGKDVCSPVFSLEDWPLYFHVGPTDGTPGHWGVFLGSKGLGKATHVPEGYELKRVRADYTLSCPDHGWSGEVHASSATMTLSTQSWGFRKAVEVQEGVTKLKVRGVITKLVAELRKSVVSEY